MRTGLLSLGPLRHSAFYFWFIYIGKKREAEGKGGKAGNRAGEGSPFPFYDLSGKGCCEYILLPGEPQRWAP